MSKILIIVDVQNDFCEGGSLEVRNSNQIFPPINALKKSNFFSHVVLTLDSHPQDHVSFANTHDMEPFTSIQINGKVQELWPKHCVADTYGAELSKLLERNYQEICIKKGELKDVDSYSGFYVGNDQKVELREILTRCNATEVYVCGLSFDFCVGQTALDSAAFGFKTFVVTNASRSVSKQTSQKMQALLKDNDIKLVTSQELL